jgi:hypothetical protein
MSEANSMLIIFFDIMGIVHKEFVLAGQTYYCDILWRLHENARGLCPEVWLQKKWQCTVSHFFFHPGIFLPKPT